MKMNYLRNPKQKISRVSSTRKIYRNLLTYIFNSNEINEINHFNRI